MKRILFTVIIAFLATSVFAQENGSDGLGDSFYPQMGNGGYDVQHYTIDLDFNPEENFLSGTTTIEAIAEQGLASFNLDFFGMDIEQITVNAVEATFSRDGSELTLTPPTSLSTDEAFTVVVAYSGVPEVVNDLGVPFIGLGWQEWDLGYFAAVSEPSGSMNWFPANNHPLDKATFTFDMTVPQPYVVVANGILTENYENPENQQVTSVWEMTDPMASYLAIVAVGEFYEIRDDSGDVLIRNYFSVGTSQSTIDDYAVTNEMMVYLTDLVGEYPFDAYGVVTVPGFPAALETQTLSIFGINAPGEGTIMHELLHQWFGDSVTVADWSDIWLHEGFAVYFSALWSEERDGREVYEDIVSDWYASASRNDFIAPASIEIDNLFGGTVYIRGALVLHALRIEVGDDVFFEILRTFYANHAYDVATTEDFISVAESVSGQDLDNLFEGWLFSDILPALED